MRSFSCTALPGIPTIRPFEAMACGIPLITTRWRDTEQLFREGKDYLMAKSPGQMRRLIQSLIASKNRRQELAGRALETIRRRHQCDLRAGQLEDICGTLRAKRG
jgi:spore maturation protein CgeB